MFVMRFLLNKDRVGLVIRVLALDLANELKKIPMTKALGIIYLLLIGTVAFGQKNFSKQNISFKIVGYYLLRPALNDTIYTDSNYLFLNKITHLNIAFINPDTSGNFDQHLTIDTLIKMAHEKKVKVLASIGGGGYHPYFKTLLEQPNREAFISNLLFLIKRYNLDGIDIDLEGSDIGDNYGSFITELSASLHHIKKLITAAIATTYKDQFPDKAIHTFDFVNIMSYDRWGPWRPQDPGDPSPYTMAEEDLNYWHNERSIPKEKMILGLPFYGYGFGPPDSPVVSMNYQHIATLYADKLHSDTLLLPGNVTMYYNNISTIQNKTRLAMKEAGGVMIWQLSGDAKGEYSLLDAIYNVVHGK